MAVAPDHANARYNLAVVLWDRGDLDGSTQLLREVRCRGRWGLGGVGHISTCRGSGSVTSAPVAAPEPRQALI